MWRLIGCVALALVACRRPAAAERPLLERYPVRSHVQWTEKQERGGELTSRRREERWLAQGPRTWEVVTRDVGGGGAPFRARYALLDDGALAQVAVFDGETVLPVTPPKVVLPASARPGETWAAEHRVGKRSSRRSCRLVAFDGCPAGAAGAGAEGIEERCTTSFDDGRTVEVQNRWCVGVGQVGYRSTTRARGAHESVRIWSEDLVELRD